MKAIGVKHLSNTSGIVIYAINDERVVYEHSVDRKIRKARLYYSYSDSYYFYDCYRCKHYINEFMRCNNG